MSQEFHEQHEAKTEQSSAASEPDRELSQAIEQGASRAAEDVDRLLPQVGRVLGKGVYGAFYYGSYGVVFGALTLGRLVPKDNVVVHAIQDGAVAARESVEHGHAVEHATGGAPEAEPATG